VHAHRGAGAVRVPVGDGFDDVLVLAAVFAMQFGVEGAFLQPAPDRLLTAVDEELADPDEDDVVGGEREAVVQRGVPSFELFRGPGAVAAARRR
jgi:hypothetical protein